MIDYYPQDTGLQMETPQACNLRGIVPAEGN